MASNHNLINYFWEKKKNNHKLDIIQFNHTERQVIVIRSITTTSVIASCLVLTTIPMFRPTPSPNTHTHTFWGPCKGVSICHKQENESANMPWTKTYFLIVRCKGFWKFYMLNKTCRQTGLLIWICAFPFWSILESYVHSCQAWIKSIKGFAKAVFVKI